MVSIRDLNILYSQLLHVTLSLQSQMNYYYTKLTFLPVVQVVSSCRIILPKNLKGLGCIN